MAEKPRLTQLEIDNFGGQSTTLDSTLRRIELAVPHDTNRQSFVSRAIYTAGGGTLVFVSLYEDMLATKETRAPVPVTVTLAAGWHPIRTTIITTATTITDLVIGE